MIYRGKVREGVVVLDPEIQLPEGLEVVVQPYEALVSPMSPGGLAGTMRNGVPVFPRSNSGAVPGLELVNQLRDETA